MYIITVRTIDEIKAAPKSRSFLLGRWEIIRRATTTAVHQPLLSWAAIPKNH